MIEYSVSIKYWVLRASEFISLPNMDWIPNRLFTGLEQNSNRILHITTLGLPTAYSVLYLKRLLKVCSQGLLWQQIDLDIWNLIAVLSQVTKFHNSRVRRSWKRAIIYGT